MMMLDEENDPDVQEELEQLPAEDEPDGEMPDGDGGCALCTGDEHHTGGED